eukprot:CAMPEP_0202686702 /NCGR_PEP_ID=MMETSP1385-20130828/2461_1 /ASSEMBLY_ACC=CAM_ASM_000861 /TAXON_ID=933848 /ORGANISM="Elphidium margaritaceum" /LENGTH=567 /DNA_ID=CAMNT_0049341333 /DNA_START=56 /DNA_END=1759 /DNA_ORIENTATION=+
MADNNCKIFVGLNSKKVANPKGSMSYVSGKAIACSSAIRQDDEYGAKINENDADKIDFTVVHCNKCTSCKPACLLCSSVKPALLNQKSNEWTPIQGNAGATFESIVSLIKNKYPVATGEAKKIKYQILRVTVDGEIWIVPYMKKIPLSTLIRSTSPSGYKKEGRISVGDCLAIQGDSNKNLVMVIKKDPAYDDPEFESKEAVVNAVGFWGLDVSDGCKVSKTRYIIQLLESHIAHTRFEFYRRKNAPSVRSISVDFVSVEKNKEGRPINLFSWSAPSAGNGDAFEEEMMHQYTDGSCSPSDSATDSSSASGCASSDRSGEVLALTNHLPPPQPPISIPVSQAASHRSRSRQFQSMPPLDGYRRHMEQQRNYRRNERRQNGVNNLMQTEHTPYAHMHNNNNNNSRNDQAHQPAPMVPSCFADHQLLLTVSQQLTHLSQQFVELRSMITAQNGMSVEAYPPNTALSRSNYHFNQEQQQQMYTHGPCPGVHYQHNRQSQDRASHAEYVAPAHCQFEPRQQMQNVRSLIPSPNPLPVDTASLTGSDYNFFTNQNLSSNSSDILQFQDNYNE